MQALRQSVRIGSTMLAGTGKSGILKPDSQGYYPCPVGAYNAYNSAGYLYDEKSGLVMFEPGSPLMRQVEKGCLYGEYKHPVRAPGMSDAAYMARIRNVDMDRASHHIREYEIIPSKDEHGRVIKLVIAWTKPWGPYGQYVEESFQNPAMTTYFSVRSITIDDVVQRVKFTREVVTHDFVGEGGIFVANKHMAPSLEDFENTLEITPETLFALADEQKQNRNLGLEHSGADYEGLIKELGWQRAKQAAKPVRPSFMRW